LFALWGSFVSGWAILTVTPNKIATALLNWISYHSNNLAK
jgi:hypothetical protein